MKKSIFQKEINQGPILLQNDFVSGCMILNEEKAITIKVRVNDKPKTQNCLIFNHIANLDNILLGLNTLFLVPETTIKTSVQYVINSKNASVLQAGRWHFAILYCNCSFELLQEYDKNNKQATTFEIDCGNNITLEINTKESWQQNRGTSKTVAILSLKFHSDDGFNIEDIQEISNKVNSILSIYSGKPVSSYDIVVFNNESDDHANITLNTINHPNIVDKDIKLFHNSLEISDMFSNLLIKDMTPAHLWRLYIELNDLKIHRISYLEQRLELICRCIECLCNIYAKHLSPTQQEVDKLSEREEQFNALIETAQSNAANIGNNTIKWLRGRRREFLNRVPFDGKIKYLAESGIEQTKITNTIITDTDKIAKIRNQLAHNGIIDQVSLDFLFSDNNDYITNILEPFARQELVRYLKNEYKDNANE